jgi:DNA-directed RNA polymerase specialized sigma24 family protein
MDLEQTHARFATTRWTLIEALRGDDPARQHEALSRLVECYWPAVYGYLRRTRMDREQASEVTQAFFADVVLSRDLFSQADATAGRLRSLLMSALKRYLIDRHRRRAARRESTSLGLGSIEDAEAMLDSTRHEDPEAAFDRAWAASVLGEALRRCEKHYADADKRPHWLLFEARIVRPAVHGVEPPALPHEAEKLGFRSASDAAAAVQTVKRRVNSLLADVVAETVSGGVSIDDELAALRLVLA